MAQRKAARFTACSGKDISTKLQTYLSMRFLSRSEIFEKEHPMRTPSGKRMRFFTSNIILINLETGVNLKRISKLSSRVSDDLTKTERPLVLKSASFIFL